MRDIMDFMKDIVKILEQSYYGDVRFESGQRISVGKNKSEENILSGSSSGLTIRVLSGDRWYYLGFDEINKSRIMPETKKLVKKAGKKRCALAKEKPWKVDKEVKIKENPDDVSIEEKIKTVRQIFGDIVKNDKIVNAGVGLGHSLSETIFMNTEGSVLRQRLPYFRFVISAIAKENGKVEQDYFVAAKQGGYEIFNQLDVNKKIGEVVSTAVSMLKAKAVLGGKHDIIIDPEIAGLIAHESFGHGLEADQVMRGRSYLTGLRGKKIVSDLITMHDNGSLAGERGFLFFDDEGVKTRDNILVKNGVLQNFIHDRQSAAYMSENLTGNGRAQDFTRRVFVRMTNTYFEPGKWKHDELLKDTKEGFYLVKASTGMEDPLGGNLQAIVSSARIIKNGELGELYKGVGITGKVLDFLNRVDALTNDFDVRGSGCGKGHEDYIPVSAGGPYMRIRQAMIG